MLEMKGIIVLSIFVLGVSWSMLFADNLTVDFSYPPPYRHTAICPPDDTYKTLVDQHGHLLYHYTRNQHGFQTTLALTVDEQAKTADQTLVSSRVPIVQTRRETGDLTIQEEIFALRQEGPVAKTWKYPAARKDGSRMHRHWANPQGDVTKKLSSIVIPGETAIMYNIQTPPGAAVKVALGICEGFYDQPDKRVMHLRVEGAPAQQVDTGGDLGKNVAGTFWFDARDVDHDGFINLTVIATENSQDKVAILNGFWVFEKGAKINDADLLAGKLDDQAALALYAGDRDNISRNDVILVHVTNTGSAEKTVEPKVTINSMLSLELLNDRIRIDGHEVVLATLPIAGLTEADAANGRRDAIMKLAPLTLPAGQTTSFAVVYCGGGWIDAQPTNLTGAQQARQRCRSFWETVDLPYDRINVPDKKIQALIDSSIRNIWQAREIINGMPSFQVGATCYRSLFIVDGSFILEAATIVGAGEDTRAGVEFMLSFQQDDGRFEILSRYHKENGIVLWTCVRHAMLTQDKPWLKSVWPKLEKTVAYIKQLRRLSYEDPSILNDGLMPPGYPDGGIGWHNHYEYTNVYWNLLGLKSIIQAARWIGNDRQADEWQREYDDFYATFRRAAERDMRYDIHGNRYLPILMTLEDRVLKNAHEWYYPCKAQWSFCHGVYPGQLFEKDDALVKGNLDMLATYKKEGMIATTGWTTEGIWNYFASFYGHALLWQGNGRAATEQLYAMANHASPLLTWVEEQEYRETPNRSGGGDMPHNWASAEFIRLAMHLLALDRGHELHLFEGLPAEWTQPGMVTRMNGAATPFGPLSFTLRISDDGKSATLQIDPLPDQSCEKIVVHLGGWATSDSQAIQTLTPNKQHEITIPIIQ